MTTVIQKKIISFITCQVVLDSFKEFLTSFEKKLIERLTSATPQNWKIETPNKYDDKCSM